MTTCFIKWDNSYSYKLANPDNNFSIINVNGSAFKITWDGGGSGKEHIINNPDNYSYSIINANSTYNYSFIGSNWLMGGSEYGSSFSSNWSYSKLLFLNSLSGRTNSNFYSGKNVIFIPLVISPVSSSYQYIHLEFKDINNNSYYAIVARTYIDANFSINTATVSNTTINFTHHNASWINGTFGVISNPPQLLNLIRISDNNIIYYYPITNTNSVEIIYSSGGKKIQIEGKQFDIVDENSAYKDCEKHCPNGLIECQCGNQLCCYKKTNSGYKLVSTIKL